ncbi:MAG: hypothetical protein AB7T49_15250 [Oligoflexales bacterium]
MTNMTAPFDDMTKNLAFRKHLKQMLTEEALSNTKDIPLEDIDQLESKTWQALALRIDQDRKKWSNTVSGVFNFFSDLRKVYILGPAFATALLGFFYLKTQQEPESAMGIKSGQDEEQIEPTLVGLRFAKVTEEGTLKSGEDFMELPVGATIVFYVEGKNITKDNPLTVKLEHELADEHDVLFENYGLTQDRQLLSEATSYFAYTLAKKGVHKFSLSNIRKKTEEKKDDVAFSVVAVGP